MPEVKEITVAWFSTGVSSAVAIKLMIEKIDRIVYIDIDDQHEDSMRFVKDCEKWFGKEIEIIKSDYKSVENACKSSGGRGYINGPKGAACTKFLKRRLRAEWERQFENCNLTYIWGMDSDEADRLEKLFVSMPDFNHFCPLIDMKITKARAHEILNASGIKRPAMYDLGYHNNNCIGCVKGGMGYWNHIRVDFPEVFKARALMEREIQATCIKGVYLDELDPDRGRHAPPIVDDCGIFCEMSALD